jgi:hypothetical protein
MTNEHSQRPASTEPTASTAVSRELHSEAERILPAIVAGTGRSDDADERSEGGVRRSPSPEASGFAEHVHQYQREYIALADQKAGFIFAASSALLAYVYQQDVHLRWLKSVGDWSATDVAALLGMGGLFVGLVAAALVVVPRLASTHKGLIFFLSVAEHPSAGEYSAAVANETGESLTAAVLQHVYDLALVARRKYRVLNVAIVATAVGAALSFLVLLL